MRGYSLRSSSSNSNTNQTPEPTHIESPPAPPPQNNRVSNYNGKTKTTPPEVAVVRHETTTIGHRPRTRSQTKLIQSNNIPDELYMIIILWIMIMNMKKKRCLEYHQGYHQKHRNRTKERKRRLMKIPYCSRIFLEFSRKLYE